MPKFVLFVRATAEAENGTPPDRTMLDEMSAFNKALAAAVTLHDAEGLLDSSRGARVRFSPEGETTVTNGPFPHESLVSGYWFITAVDLAEAVSWARKVPFHSADHVVEVRQVASSEDFPELGKNTAEEK